MSVQRAQGADTTRRATRDDVRHMLGELDDVVVAEILAAQPSYSDLSEATIWARGDGDLTAREHKELSAEAIAVAEILVRQEDGDEPQPT